MDKKIIRLNETTSTNDYLRGVPTPCSECMAVAVAGYQTAGRGQGTNTWESECGKNLLFSILTSPTGVDVTRQFILSMAGALALKAALDVYCDGITLKWPNDIYWHDRKISGTLIETSVRGGIIARCIYGIGLNVNQCTFRSDAPNPVSLVNITGRYTPLDTLLDSILLQFDRYYSLATSPNGACPIVADYHRALYRRDGMYAYEDTGTHEVFSARIDHVGFDGRLHLVDSDGRQRAYTFKQVKFV